jgi:surface antigen
MHLSKKLIAVALAGCLGVAGCATDGSGWGDKQTIGTVVGAVVGAGLGSLIGKGGGRTAAVIVGAIAGGALGNWIGNNLDKEDQAALAASTQQALETGQPVDWKSDHSGATAKIDPVSSTTVTQKVQVTRAPAIVKVNDMSVLSQTAYQAVKSANLRAAPNATAAKVGGLTPGQTFTALGKTQNDWIAVGRKGVLVGYVSAPLVAPAQSGAPDQSTDLDSITAVQASRQGFDLDAMEPAKAVTEEVAVQTTCRTVKYDVKTSQGQESKTVDACQAADGSWQLG